MAAPNIRNPSFIIGKTSTTSNVSTSLSAILTNSSGSNKVFKINSIFAANTNGANNTTVSISIYNGSTDTYLARTIGVPADATQIISTKETYFYLEEGFSIRAQAGNSNYIDVVISYEEISNV
jgi:hypothetical protein